MTRRVALVAAAFVLAGAPDASAHRERPTTFPDPALGSVPRYRTGGPALVVCKSDSQQRSEKLSPAARNRSLTLLPSCRFAHVQAAVEAAAPGTRILVLPGVYREEPSRAAPSDDPRCANLKVEEIESSVVQVASYAYQQQCPNA